ncbi:hypothetical protein BDZ97DRAFT_1635169, partial [Flammula alnicola]
EKDASLPQYSLDLGDGYAFLRAKEKYGRKLENHAQAQVVSTYFLEREAEFGNFPDDDWDGLRVARWARLRLPNGQTARSKWKEDKMTTPNLRRACCVKTSPDKVDFAEVQFYFHGMINEERQPLALVSLFSEPDPALLQASYQTVYSVQKLAHGLCVINAKSIIAVIAVIPHNYQVNGDPEQRYFIWEKMGMDMALLTN